MDQNQLRKAIALCLGVSVPVTVTLTVRQQHVEALTPALTAHAITTCDRVAAVMAQFAHETGGFVWLRELGGPTYFRRYEGRMGNTRAGDGYRYRGRGYLHLTGRANYRAMAEKTGYPLLAQPDLMATMPVAAEISARWWDEQGLNALADRRDIQAITRIVNGGYNGLPERLRRTAQLRRGLEKAGLCDD